MTKLKVLVACEFSGIVRDAFESRGHDAVSCDLLPSETFGEHIQDNVMHHLNEGWDAMFAFPPCTDITVAGARYFKEKIADGRQQKAINFFMELVNAPIPKICIENPIGIMSTVYRKPDQIIQPWMFGHNETKSTCLWLKGLPPLLPNKFIDNRFVKGRKQRVFLEPPSNERWKNRSRTLPGIAKAMSEQWSEP